MGNGLEVTGIKDNYMWNSNSGNVIDSGNTTYNINIFDGNKKGHKPHGRKMPIGPNGHHGPYRACHCNEGTNKYDAKIAKYNMIGNIIQNAIGGFSPAGILNGLSLLG